MCSVTGVRSSRVRSTQDEGITSQADIWIATRCISCHYPPVQAPLTRAHITSERVQAPQTSLLACCC